MSTTKQKNGKLSDDRTGHSNVVASTRIPTAPKFLKTASSKKIYRSICKFLISQSAMTDIDSLYIAQAAICFDRYSRMELFFAENPDDIIQTFQTGARQISPEYQVLLNERKAFEVFARRLGLNVAAREKLVSMQAEAVQEDDFLANIIKMKAMAN